MREAKTRIERRRRVAEARPHDRERAEHRSRWRGADEQGNPAEADHDSGKPPAADPLAVEEAPGEERREEWRSRLKHSREPRVDPGLAPRQ